MTTHNLKCWPVPFQAILDGRKTCEIRTTDRDFQCGDRMVLKEWDKNHDGLYQGDHYTKREIAATITHIVMPGQWGLPADLCVLSFKKDS